MQTTDITQLLAAVSEGDQQANEQLMSVLYQQLHTLAHFQINRTGNSPTLCTTAVVNEAYLRLFREDQQPDWKNRKHFFACAAMAMRQLLIDYARRRMAEKRSAEVPMPTVAPQAGDEQALDLDELLELDQALTRLSSTDEHLCKVVELRFFSGLTVEQVAELYNCSSRTIVRDWRRARAFLNAAVAA